MMSRPFFFPAGMNKVLRLPLVSAGTIAVSEVEPTLLNSPANKSQLLKKVLDKNCASRYIRKPQDLSVSFHSSATDRPGN